MIARVVVIAHLSLLLSACGLIGNSSEDDAEPGTPSGEGSADEEREPEVSNLPETEPNDSRELAMQIPLGRPLAGTVSETDLDIYLLPAGTEPATVVLASESALELDVLRPQDAAGYTLTKAVAEDLRLPRVSRAASLFFTVRGTGAYTLTVESLDDGRAPCGFGHEPDDAFSVGAVMHSVPATATGCISTPDDIDYFLLPAEAFAGVPGFGLSLSPVAGVSLRVVAKDRDGTVLAEMNGDAGSTIEFPNLRVPAEGGIRFEVRSQSGANESEPYRLNLSRLPALNGTIELEPNDERITPTLLTEIGLVNGYIHRPGDEDYYVLTTEEPMLVRLFAESPQDVDLRVEVETEEFGRLVINNAGAGEPERLCSLTVDADGAAFRISAGNFQRTEREPYLLHFEFIEGANWEIEPNNAVQDVLLLERQLEEGARPDVALWLGEAIVPYAQGYAFPPGDYDRFVVEVFGDPLAAVTYKSVTVRLEPSAPADYSLELVDEAGATVGISNEGGVGESETLALDLPSGLYVARVTFIDGEPCERPYRISVQQTEIPENQRMVDWGQIGGDREIIPTRVLGGSGDGADAEDGDGSGSADRQGRRIDPSRLRPRVRPQLEIRPGIPPRPSLRVPIGEAGHPERVTEPPTFGGESGR